MTNINITEARKKLFELAESAIDYNNVVNITTRKGNVIMMSEDEYNGMMETMYLLGIPGNRERLFEAMNTLAAECAEVDWRKKLGGE